MGEAFEYTLEEVGMNRRVLLMNLRLHDWEENENWYQEQVRMLDPMFIYYSLDELFSLTKLLLPYEDIDTVCKTTPVYSQKLYHASQSALDSYHRVLLNLIELSDQKRQHSSMLMSFVSYTKEAYQAMFSYGIRMEVREDGLYVDFPYELRLFPFQEQTVFWLPGLALAFQKTLCFLQQSEHSVQREAEKQAPWVIEQEIYTPYAVKQRQENRREKDCYFLEDEQ